MEQELIFKCIVGSQAHGLATPESDFDYRGVFVVPTKDLLTLGNNLKTTSWIEGNEDDTSWEVGHFLHLATKCNPTILETFLAPIKEYGPNHKGDAELLRSLFPAVWNSRGVRDAFIGYAHNQRKKLLEDKDGRPYKYAAAYIRTLYQAIQLLETGTFTIRIADSPIGPFVRAVKNRDENAGFDISKGAIINKCDELEERVRAAYDKNPDKETDYDRVNDALIHIRRHTWIINPPGSGDLSRFTGMG